MVKFLLVDSGEIISSIKYIYSIGLYYLSKVKNLVLKFYYFYLYNKDNNYLLLIGFN